MVYRNIEKKRIADRKWYRNNREKIMKRRNERRKKFKQQLVDMLGGKCKKCGYNKSYLAFEFHHANGKKESDISYLITSNSKKKAIKEIKKCKDDRLY